MSLDKIVCSKAKVQQVIQLLELLKKHDHRIMVQSIIIYTALGMAVGVLVGCLIFS